MKRILRRMAPSLVTILLFLLLSALLLRVMEPGLVYHPVKAADEFFPPSANSRVQDVFFQAGDGVRLHGWWLGPRPGNPTLLICHGNAGNISHRLDWIQPFAELGWGVFIFDYRGYGKSEGKPVEEGLYRDATAAYGYAVEEAGEQPETLFLLGKSLGGAVALDLALRERCAGLILESAFTSVRDMARTMFGPLPVHWVAHSRFDNLAKIQGLRAPLLVIHGQRDEVVPFDQGRRLYEAAPDPKSFYPLERAGHNDVHFEGGKGYYDRIEQFVAGEAGERSP